MPLITIIIVSYNTKEVLKNCLNSLYAALKNELSNKVEVIVVDNASGDASVEMIKNLFPQVVLIASDENLYFARANNLGASVAKGKYLFLLNSDTLIEAGNIEKLLDFMNNANENIALCAPITLNVDNSMQSCGFALSGCFERLSMCLKLHKLCPSMIAKICLPTGTPYKGAEKINHRVGWVAGCNMFFRRDVYIKIGGLNPEVGFYGEEPEVGWRLAKAKYQTWIVANAYVIHLGGVSTSVKNQTTIDMKKEHSRMTNYSKLMTLTNGVKKGIWMSRIVVLTTKIRRLYYIITGNKFSQLICQRDIAYERRLICFMREYRKNKGHI